MAVSFSQLGVSLGINLAIVAVFLFLYSLFSTQPFNSRVYYTKWFVIDDQSASEKYERAELTESGFVKKRKYVEFSWKQYIKSLQWIHRALQMPERELIAHAGLDCAVFLRLFKLGMKIFVPCLLLGAAVLFPINYTSNNLQTLAETKKGYTYAEVDKLSISNVPSGSPLLWAHTVLAWVFAFWTWFMMRKAYREVAQMRIDFLVEQKRYPNQFSVLVRQVPDSVAESSVAKHVEHFFSVNHPHDYLLTQPVYNANKLASLDAQKEKILNKLTEIEIFCEKYPDKPPPVVKLGCLGLCGQRVDASTHYKELLEKTNQEILSERSRVIEDPKSVMPAAFVSFKSRWGAAVAAQTQQCKDNSKWITDWAPEPRDVVWSNLPIPYLSLNVRKLAAAGIVIGTILFYNIPVTFVQSLASLSGLEKQFPWLQPVLSLNFISAVLQGFLPGLALKLFLSILPYLLVILTHYEGYISKSQVHLSAAGKYFYFVVFIIFFANILIGGATSQIRALIKNPTSVPNLLGNSIPNKATFFINFTMIDAWSAVASEILRPFALILYHTRNALLVRTPQDRIKAMEPMGAEYFIQFPKVELYFLLPFVYCVIAPFYLPFVIIYYLFGYLIFRNQFINVYEAEYETGAAFWPHVHTRLIAAQIVQFITLFGVFSLKKAGTQALCILPLPFVAIIVDWVFIQGPYRSVFIKMAIEEAKKKDIIDQVRNPHEDVRGFLDRAFLHPSLKSAFELMDEEMQVAKVSEEEGAATLVPVKRHPRSQQASPAFIQSAGGRSGNLLIPHTPPILRQGTNDSEQSFQSMRSREREIDGRRSLLEGNRRTSSATGSAEGSMRGMTEEV